jgi:hypothetical protein
LKNSANQVQQSMDVGIRTRIGWTTDWRPLTPQAAEAPNLPHPDAALLALADQYVVAEAEHERLCKIYNESKPPFWIREGRTRYVFNPAKVELAMGRLIAERLFKTLGEGTGGGKLSWPATSGIKPESKKSRGACLPQSANGTKLATI